MEKEVGIEIWTLLAKYLTHEATPEERLEVEFILSQNKDLNTEFTRLMAVYYFKEDGNATDASKAFEMLNGRIKKSR